MFVDVIIDRDGNNEIINENPTGNTGQPGNDPFILRLLEPVLEQLFKSLNHPRGNLVTIPCPPLPKPKRILYDRRDPIFVVSIEGKNLDKTNISRIISSVEIDEGEDGFDTCTIEFENCPMDYVDDPIFNARNEVDIYMGYTSTGIDYMGKFVIDKPEFDFGDTINIVIRGKSISLKMAESEVQTVHHDTTELELLNRIARRRGLLAAIDNTNSNSDFLYRRHDSIAQAGISDWDLLRNRAQRNGFILDIVLEQFNNQRRPIIYYGKPRNCDSGVVLSYKDPNPFFCNVISFRPVENTYKRNTVVRIGVQDPRNIGRDGDNTRFRRFNRERRFRPHNDSQDPFELDIESPEYDDDGNIIEPPSQHICIGKGDEIPDNHSNVFNNGRRYEQIIGTSSEISGFSIEENIEISDRIRNGESQNSVVKEIFNRRNGPINDTEDPFSITFNEPEIREMIIIDHGTENNPRDACRLADSIHKSLQYVIEADVQPAIGNTKLRKGKLVSIIGVGKFSGKYYIKSVRHVIDSSGYRITGMKVKSKGTGKNKRDPKFSPERNPIPINFLDGDRQDFPIVEHRIEP